MNRNIKLTIGEVFERFSSGKSISASDIKSFGEYPVYGGNGLRGYTNKYNFEGECSIIGRQGAYCGNVKYFNGKAYMTEHAIVAAAKKEYSNGYLYYKLSLMNLGQYQGQSAQPGLSVNTLSKVSIDIPRKKIQDDVYSCLKKLEDKIELNNKINSELEAMAKTLYDYWFVQFDFPNEEGKPYKSSGGAMAWNEELKREIPVGWEVAPIKKNLRIVSGYPFSSKDYLKIGKYKIITIKNVQDRELNTAKVDYINSIPEKLSQDCILKIGDILISLTGNIGRICLVTEKNLLLNQRVGKLETSEKYLIYFYFFFLQESIFKKLENISGGSSQSNLSPLETVEILTAFPKDDIMDKFNTLLKGIFNKVIKNKIENQELASLRDWLLPMLMNGQVSVE